MFPRKLFWRTLTFFEFLYPTRTTFGPFLIKSNLFHKFPYSSKGNITTQLLLVSYDRRMYKVSKMHSESKGLTNEIFDTPNLFHPYTTKNDKNYNNYMLKFHSRPQMIKIPPKKIAIVLKVVRKTNSGSFVNRKSVFIVKKSHKNGDF